MVNTFLPYPNFKKTAEALDWRRLGKQRVEAKQILMALREETEGYRNHAATRMWRGHEGMLCLYGIFICREWHHRDYVDNLLPYFEKMIDEYETCEPPWWLGVETLHRSHQSNLIRKDPKRYGPKFPGVPPDLPYFWPEP